MKFIFIYLAFANVLDGLLTYIGLQGVYIQEANPFMSFIYELHPLFFIFVKLALSILLVGFIMFKVLPDSKIIKGTALVATVFYTIIMMLHGGWIYSVVFTPY